jgi:hypothetical protein
VPGFWTTLGLVVLAAPVLFGGVRRVAKVAEFVVPIMAIAYVLLALVIVVANITNLPRVIEQILGGAFGISEMAGGFGGGIAAAMLNGIKRGLFSNEAGMGSAPNVAATATVSHPVKQGLIQSLGVFVDTMIVCSATAFIILVSGRGIRPGSRRQHGGGDADAVGDRPSPRILDHRLDDCVGVCLRLLVGARQLRLRRGQLVLPGRRSQSDQCFQNSGAHRDRFRRGVDVGNGLGAR